MFPSLGCAHQQHVWQLGINCSLGMGFVLLASPSPFPEPHGLSGVVWGGWRPLDSHTPTLPLQSLACRQSITTRFTVGRGSLCSFSDPSSSLLAVQSLWSRSAPCGRVWDIRAEQSCEAVAAPLRTPAPNSLKVCKQLTETANNHLSTFGPVSSSKPVQTGSSSLSKVPQSALGRESGEGGRWRCPFESQNGSAVKMPQTKTLRRSTNRSPRSPKPLQHVPSQKANCLYQPSPTQSRNQIRNSRQNIENAAPLICPPSLS